MVFIALKKGPTRLSAASCDSLESVPTPELGTSVLVPLGLLLQSQPLIALSILHLPSARSSALRTLGTDETRDDTDLAQLQSSN
jgi:hypothetical protein